MIAITEYAWFDQENKNRFKTGVKQLTSQKRDQMANLIKHGIMPNHPTYKKVNHDTNIELKNKIQGLAKESRIRDNTTQVRTLLNKK